MVEQFSQQPIKYDHAPRWHAPAKDVLFHVYRYLQPEQLHTEAVILRQAPPPLFPLATFPRASFKTPQTYKPSIGATKSVFSLFSPTCHMSLNLAVLLDRAICDHLAEGSFNIFFCQAQPAFFLSSCHFYESTFP